LIFCYFDEERQVSDADVTPQTLSDMHAGAAPCKWYICGLVLVSTCSLFGTCDACRDSTKLLLEDHSTLNSQDADEQQLYNAILTHPFLKRHICKLNQQLGYPQRPQCVPPKAASTAGRDKGRPRRQPLLKDSPRGRHSNLQARYQSEDVHGMFH
jgi:hypothetical protein